ncbi:uncharacterized protein LOC110103589 [Dendrobium catenatum]|uniref:Uncharacterized protein n=1 Tax=Dendrobium catenatum TaxID=906689 RepID=A0A2I0V7Q4_9ASPA|nr:uncharacterized protein LOC110103589 [Dendrobium catenatum]PKU59436.1 hypothetical protein MA16_Dca012764 [Dendrobium catenatum]
MLSNRRTMNRGMEQHKLLLQHPSPPHSSSESETEDEKVMTNLPTPSTLARRVEKKVLSKQLSMRDMMREEKWERKKRLMYLRSLSDELVEESERDEDGKEVTVKERRERVRSLTDEDLDELKGSLDLGFGFSEENGGKELCKTLPALKLYFAINRQLSDPKLSQTPSPASTPTTTTATSSSATLNGTPSPRTPHAQPQLDQQGRPISSDDDTWRVMKPGDSPERVKARIRQWAQIVACSVKHMR